MAVMAGSLGRSMMSGQGPRWLVGLLGLCVHLGTRAGSTLWLASCSHAPCPVVAQTRRNKNLTDIPGLIKEKNEADGSGHLARPSHQGENEAEPVRPPTPSSWSLLASTSQSLLRDTGKGLQEEATVSANK